jgi:hypothetical protein
MPILRLALLAAFAATAAGYAGVPACRASKSRVSMAAKKTQRTRSRQALARRSPRPLRARLRLGGVQGRSCPGAASDRGAADAAQIAAFVAERSLARGAGFRPIPIRVYRTAGLAVRCAWLAVQRSAGGEPHTSANALTGARPPPHPPHPLLWLRTICDEPRAARRPVARAAWPLAVGMVAVGLIRSHACRTGGFRTGGCRTDGYRTDGYRTDGYRTALCRLAAVRLSLLAQRPRAGLEASCPSTRRRSAWWATTSRSRSTSRASSSGTRQRYLALA